MVRAATPDKLTVMTYLHQIKHYFENSHTKNSINLLMSQYNFMTDTEDILSTPSSITANASMKKLSPSQKTDKKEKKKKEKSPRKSKKGTSKDPENFGEIDSITDAQEINDILNQLRDDERRNELKRIEETMNKPSPQLQQRQQPSQQLQHQQNQSAAKLSADASSFDEDEMLNSIIACNETTLNYQTVGTFYCITVNIKISIKKVRENNRFIFNDTLLLG